MRAKKATTEAFCGKEQTAAFRHRKHAHTVQVCPHVHARMKTGVLQVKKPAELNRRTI